MRTDHLQDVLDIAKIPALQIAVEDVVGIVLAAAMVRVKADVVDIFVDMDVKEDAKVVVI